MFLRFRVGSNSRKEVSVRCPAANKVGSGVYRPAPIRRLKVQQTSMDTQTFHLSESLSLSSYSALASYPPTSLRTTAALASKAACQRVDFTSNPCADDASGGAHSTHNALSPAFHNQQQQTRFSACSTRNNSSNPARLEVLPERTSAHPCSGRMQVI